jgi:membrane-associated phospholipid phosphatase
MSEQTRQLQAQAIDEAEQALRQALGAVQNEHHADQVIADLQRDAAGRTVEEVARQTAYPVNASQAAHAIAHAADDVPAERRTQAVFAAAAAQVAAHDPLECSPLDEGVVRATNPPVSDAGVGPRKLEAQRELLRRALLKQLKPYQAVDSAIFLEINHLPHPRVFNILMRWLTIAMKRADAMALMLLVAGIRDPIRGSRAMADALPALWVTTAIMEVPVKRFFRRRRPFTDVVRAIVVGRRPGSYSFPSGHSAAAFAGAALLRRHYPRWTAAIYLLATMVGFSRVYLGAHYPGDVVTGGLGGTVLAEVSRAVLSRPTRRLRFPLFRLLSGLRWLMR